MFLERLDLYIIGKASIVKLLLFVKFVLKNYSCVLCNSFLLTSKILNKSFNYFLERLF
jgi:hypothetical protein